MPNCSKMRSCFKMPFQFILLLFTVMHAIHAGPAYAQSSNPMVKIRIKNLQFDIPPTGRTRFQAGPNVGDILNWHFFPGLQDFKNGNYESAVGQMNYFIERPQYTSENPRQPEFMTLAFYIRGSVYLDHAEGIGRLGLALSDFKAALSWKDDNYPAMIGLAKVYMATNQNDDAKNVLKLLLSKNPTGFLATEANDLLEQADSPYKTPGDSEEISPDTPEAADDVEETGTSGLQAGGVDSTETSKTDAPAKQETKDVNSTDDPSTDH